MTRMHLPKTCDGRRQLLVLRLPRVKPRLVDAMRNDHLLRCRQLVTKNLASLFLLFQLCPHLRHLSMYEGVDNKISPHHQHFISYSMQGRRALLFTVGKLQSRGQKHVTGSHPRKNIRLAVITDNSRIAHLWMDLLVLSLHFLKLHCSSRAKLSQGCLLGFNLGKLTRSLGKSNNHRKVR